MVFHKTNEISIEVRIKNTIVRHKTYFNLKLSI